MTAVHRLLSLCVVAAYAAAALYYDLATSMGKLLVPVLLAAACIWFPDELGDFAGVVHYRAITASSPATLLRAVGWVVLVAVPLIALLLARATSPA